MSASSLITKALALLSPEAVRSTADSVGEKSDTMRRLLEGAVPVVLAGLTGQVGTGDGAARLLDVIRGGNAGVDLIALVLGPRAAEITETLAKWAGVRGAAATQALQSSASLVMKVLAEENSRRPFTPASLAEFLRGQHGNLAAFLPGPLKALFGFVPAVARAVESVSTLTRMAQVLAVAGVLAGVMLFYRGCGEAKAPEAPPEPVVVAKPEPRQVEVKLPSGKAVNLLEGSFNYKLVRFLEDKNDRNLPRTFVFDHLNFFTAKTEITPESRPTVDDLIAILEAYPDTDVRLEGHTDSQGNPDANQKLSEDRATAIRALLTGRGIAARRIATAGFGQTKPIASNETEAGRAENRRLELVVVKK